MTNLLHSAHDRPDLPLRGEEVEQVVDGTDALMLSEGALLGVVMVAAAAGLSPSHLSQISQTGNAIDASAVGDMAVEG
jgi:hypothetical protein